MKVYKREPKPVTRIELLAGIKKSKCFTLEDTNAKDVLKLIIDIFKDMKITTEHHVMIQSGKYDILNSVRIRVYDACGNEHKNMNQRKVYGLTVDQVKEIIISNLK